MEEESAAAEGGMQRGDVIREVNRQRVRGLPDFERVTRDVKEGDRVPCCSSVASRPSTYLHHREG